MPICALAAAVRRSAAAMSGRRSSSCEGTPSGTLGSARSSGEGGMLKPDKIVVGDGADGVLVLRARHAHVDKLRAHGFKLRLRLGHVHLGGHAAGKAALGQVELAFADRRRWP